MEFRTIFIVTVWVIFLITLGRAARRDKLRQPSRRRIWLMFFLSILAFTFWGEATEMALDQYFNHLPLALYLKYVCLIWVCHLYLQMLLEVDNTSPARSYLSILAPTATALGLVSFIHYTLFRPVLIEELRYIVIGVRDGVVLLYILLGFLAGTLSMWRREKIQAMRLKQTFILLFFTSFSILAPGSMIAAIMTLFHFGDAPAAATFLEPMIYPGVLFFIMMLVPYRWYFGLLHLQRLYTYYRLKQVEISVVQLAGTQPDSYTLWDVVKHPVNLELAIYRTLISILDWYPLTRNIENKHPIFSEIHHCVIDNSDYSDLVGALAAIR